MALRKAIELDSGVVVTYHRILTLEADFTQEPIARVRVGSYTDEAARRAGKQPVIVREFIVSADGGDVARSTVYPALAAPLPMREERMPREGAKPLRGGRFREKDMVTIRVPARQPTGLEEADAA